MLNELVSWHSFIAANEAIILSYLFTKVLFSISYINLNTSQRQKLILARCIFATTIITFILLPLIAAQHSVSLAEMQFTPGFQHVSRSISNTHTIISNQFDYTPSLTTHVKLSTLLILAWIVGSIIAGFHYIKSIFKLKKIAQQAFCLHNLSNTRILIIDSNTSSYCWSFLHKNYVALPHHLLTKAADKKISLRHEMQHLRQGDTRWMQLMQIAFIFFYLNPLMKAWISWFNHLQEFACDEEIILRSKTTATDYAQCLINAAAYQVAPATSLTSLAMNGFSTSILYRRVNMLFTYKTKKRKIITIATYILSVCTISSVAVAENMNSLTRPVTSDVINAIIVKENLNNNFHINVTPEIVAEINRIRTNEQDRANMNAALNRMNQYKPFITSELKNASMPTDLLALPLIESGYQPLRENINPVQAAGVWQFIPDTAKKYGLIINQKRDDRLDAILSTKAAISYLSTLHKQFHDWKLAVIAYEFGEHETALSMHASTPKDEVKKFVTMFDAAIIIMHDPTLITG